MTVFYRKYRPQKFEDLTGQESVSKTILAQLESGKIGHGYLFWGPRGTGKTSAARILAKAVNCEKYVKSKTKKEELIFGEPCDTCVSCTSIKDGSSLDLIEIDAASNRGIDEIRDLREKIKLSPVYSRFKVYIIDEAHMLTTEAFNALLKTLEEPPGHAIFILATTEMNKLPQTIVSRLQKFNFQRATKLSLTKVIEKIAKAEGIKIKDSAISEIIGASDGSFRDALSVLDQVAAEAKGEISDADVLLIAKTSSWENIYNFVLNLADKKIKDLITQIEDAVVNGADMMAFSKQIVLFLEKILFLKVGVTAPLTETFSSEQIEKVSSLAEKFTTHDLQRLIKLFLMSEGEMKLYPLPQIPLTLAVFKYIGDDLEGDGEEKESQPKADRFSDEKGIKIIRKTDKIGETGDDKTDLVVKNADEEKITVKNKRKSTITLAKVEENWGRFLNKVKGINAHVVALLKSARPTDVDGDFLMLEVFYRFHKQKLEEPKIIKMLDAEMSDILGSAVKFKFLLATRTTELPVAVKKSDVADIKEDELEKMAQEIFAK